MENLHEETRLITQQRAKKMRADLSNSLFLRMLIMLIPFLIYSISLHAQPDTRHIGIHQGVHWKCANCRTYQWQATNMKDWKGEYHCTRCGAKR